MVVWLINHSILSCFLVSVLTHHGLEHELCASSGGIAKPLGSALLFLLSILFVDETTSLHKNLTFHAGWEPSCYMCVRLMATVETCRSDHNSQRLADNVPVHDWFYLFFRQFEGGTLLTFFA